MLKAKTPRTKPLKQKSYSKKSLIESFNKLPNYDKVLFYINVSLFLIFIVSLILYLTTIGGLSNFNFSNLVWNRSNQNSSGLLEAPITVSAINLSEPSPPEDAMLFYFSEDIQKSTEGKLPSEESLRTSGDANLDSSLTFDNKKPSVNRALVPTPIQSAGQISNSSINYPKPVIPEFSDQIGTQITFELSKVGYNMGFIYSKPLISQGFSLPFPITEEGKNSSFKPLKPLASIRSPENGPKNRLEFPKFNITAPLIYTSFQDLYGTREDGTIDFFSDPGTRNYGAESPVQVKLQSGVVHMAFSPTPGEIGNSYIVGHTSNYSFVRSDYNTIFAPLVYQTQNGDEFFIYDYEGRKLKFRVFENLAISENDVATAYKTFGEKRVVTLQGSILERVNGRNLPTKRWLVRGELVD
jgi:hypothetical protein